MLITLCAVCAGLLYVTKLAPMLVWHLSDQKTFGKAFIVLPFALRCFECDGRLPVHLRSSTTPVFHWHAVLSVHRLCFLWNSSYSCYCIWPCPPVHPYTTTIQTSTTWTAEQTNSLHVFWMLLMIINKQHSGSTSCTQQAHGGYQTAQACPHYVWCTCNSVCVLCRQNIESQALMWTPHTHTPLTK